MALTGFGTAAVDLDLDGRDDACLQMFATKLPGGATPSWLNRASILSEEFIHVEAEISRPPQLSCFCIIVPRRSPETPHLAGSCPLGLTKDDRSGDDSLDSSFCEWSDASMCLDASRSGDDSLDSSLAECSDVSMWPHDAPLDMSSILLGVCMMMFFALP